MFQRIATDQRIRTVVLLAALFTALSFVYSFTGFLHPEFGSHYHEYSPAKLAIEIGGHFLFGFIATLPMLDLRLSLLGGSTAVLIDVDHLLSALNLNVNGRPDHSILYLLVSTAFFIYLANKMNLNVQTRTKIYFIGIVTLLSHISYDIFAAGPVLGTQFPILFPFNVSNIEFPFYAWIIFEALAVIVSALALFTSTLRSRRVEPGIQTKKAGSETSSPG